nr:hypothetical protein CFP56_68695 [Quercus suber]
MGGTQLRVRHLTEACGPEQAETDRLVKWIGNFEILYVPPGEKQSSSGPPRSRAWGRHAPTRHRADLCLVPRELQKSWSADQHRKLGRCFVAQLLCSKDSGLRDDTIIVVHFQRCRRKYKTERIQHREGLTRLLE